MIGMRLETVLFAALVCSFPFVSLAQDSDGDGMPDQWEVLNGTNASVADASGNPDTDGLSNTDEVMVGSDSLGYYDQNVFKMFLFVGRGKGYNTP